MHEFMLLVRNEIGYQSDWSADQHRQFLNKCEDYIAGLEKNGKLKSAHPLIPEGAIIAGPKGVWHELPFPSKKEVVVGYYHIVAESMAEAVEIAKGNPEFDYGTTARVEVRPVRMREESTGFVYPESDE